MRISPKWRLTTVAVLIVAFLGSMAAFAAAPVKITLWTYPQDGRPEWFIGGAQAFMAQNPDVEVEVVSGWYSALTVQAAGGVYADVIHFDAQYLPQMAVNGFVMALDDYVAKDLDTKPYIPILFDQLKYKGKLYGVPRDVDPLAYRYNRVLFQERGMADPDAKWTWNSLVENSKKLTLDKDGDGIMDQYGFMDHFGNSLVSPVWVWQAGGELWNEDYTKALVDSPQAIQGWQFSWDLRHTHNVAPPTNDQGAWKNQQPWPHFTAGKVGIMFETRSRLSASSIPFDYGIAPVAIGPTGKHVSGMTLGFMGISPHSPNKDAAWRLIKFLASKEGFQAGREENKELGFHSLFSPITQQTIEQLNREGERGGINWLNMMQVARMTNGRHPSGAFSISKPNWNTVLAGVSVADACKELANGFNVRVEELIAQGTKW